MHQFNALFLLVTRFEEFMADYLSELFRTIPEKYVNGKTIEFGDIAKLGDIDKVRDAIINREVDAHMHENYHDFFKLLSSHGMRFTTCQTDINELMEISARRNIWVHNRGIVNSTYLSLVKNTTLVENQKAYINKEYIQRAVTIIKTVMYAVIIETCKIIKGEEAKANFLEKIFTKAFDSLIRGENTLCKYVYNEIMHNKNASEEVRIMSKVDYWLCIIDISGLDTVKKDIIDWNVDKLDDKFKLAKETLLENYDDAVTILDVMINEHALTAYEVESWPLFKRFRASSEYQVFVQKHKEEYDNLHIDAGDSDNE